MRCRDGGRPQDILDAVDAIRSHVARGGLADGHVTGAVEHDLEMRSLAELRAARPVPVGLKLGAPSDPDLIPGVTLAIG